MNNDTNYIMIRDGDLTCPLHINPELEIVLVEKGTIKVNNEELTEELNSGEAMLILPYRLHSFTPSQNTVARVYMFSFSLSGELYDTYKSKSFSKFSFIPSDEAQTYTDASLRYYLESNDPITLKSIFYVFISEFLKTNKPLSSDSTSPNIIRNITEYMYSNLAEPLTLTSVAADLHITRSSLNAVFNKYIGMTFASFLKNLRIEKATTLILKGDLNVTETAYACGFGSLRSFNRAFLARMHCTPSQYKKKYDGKCLK